MSKIIFFLCLFISNAVFANQVDLDFADTDYSAWLVWESGPQVSNRPGQNTSSFILTIYRRGDRNRTPVDIENHFDLFTTTWMVMSGHAHPGPDILIRYQKRADGVYRVFNISFLGRMHGTWYIRVCLKERGRSSCPNPVQIEALRI